MTTKVDVDLPTLAALEPGELFPVRVLFLLVVALPEKRAPREWDCEQRFAPSQCSWRFGAIPGRFIAL